MKPQTDRVKRSNRLSLLSTGLALLITFILLMVHQYVIGRQQMLEELSTEAAIVGANSSAALVFRDAKAAQETLGAVRLNPRITGGALYQVDGERLAITGDWPFPPGLIFDRTEAPLEQLNQPIAMASHWSGEVLRENIQMEGSQVGTLLLHVSFASLYWRMLEYALGVLAIATVALILAYRLTAGLRRRMVRAEEQLQLMAFYDQISGLPNRSLFERELRQAVARVTREPKGAALLCIDVDDFKKINDSLGHAVGDQALRMIGERLSAVLRSGDVVARLGGDEFAAILYGIGDPDNAARVARQMIEAVAQPLPTLPRPSHVGLSVGVLLLPCDESDPTILLQRADMAMYVAKTHGKSGFRFFSEAIDARVRNDLELESGLRQALQEDGGGLWVAYQPQLNAQTRELVGVEALARWRRADGQLVSPAEFIPVAERCSLIAELGDWVLNQVCRDLATLRANGVELPRVSINVSPLQLLHGCGIVERICKTLEHFGENVKRFEFELTESALMDGDGSVVLDAFHTAGFALSIDDFGTGYSSFGHIKRFCVGELKIDQRFVRDLPDDGENAAIVRAVIQMAHALSLIVVAEGVETPQQAEFLRHCGCDILQGYLLGRPMPAAQLRDYVQERCSVE
ncbi:EAL domain-containing protein [Rhodoferax sp.]|uniref:putative bifunctional diguanylate cyclase/phosphodiesterase n=1 Tax=Rhodoferax sp. TaxID=50421 RepID=UPI0026066205|nr:EAL domain-containing protein [Rhodoferax sp.]MDD2925161.1 EAL domain-containing protein [Rhodoferax sp.]